MTDKASMAPPSTGRVLKLDPDTDRRIVLNAIDWQTYRKISDALTDCHVELRVCEKIAENDICPKTDGLTHYHRTG